MHSSCESLVSWHCHVSCPNIEWLNALMGTSLLQVFCVYNQFRYIFDLVSIWWGWVREVYLSTYSICSTKREDGRHMTVIPDHSKHQIVTTFLSILELVFMSLLW